MHVERVDQVVGDRHDVCPVEKRKVVPRQRQRGIASRRSCLVHCSTTSCRRVQAQAVHAKARNADMQAHTAVTWYRRVDHTVPLCTYHITHTPTQPIPPGSLTLLRRPPSAPPLGIPLIPHISARTCIRCRKRSRRLFPPNHSRPRTSPLPTLKWTELEVSAPSFCPEPMLQVLFEARSTGPDPVSVTTRRKSDANASRIMSEIVLAQARASPPMPVSGKMS